MEKNIVGILLSNELADLTVENKKENYQYRFLKVTEKGLSLIKDSDVDIPIEAIREYIRVYNPNYSPRKNTLTVNEETIKKKLQTFINDNPDVTIDNIISSYKSCRQEKGDFCRKPEYFIYKKLSDGSYVSQLEEYLGDEPPNFATNI